jgi:hypothetical protein
MAYELYGFGSEDMVFPLCSTLSAVPAVPAVPSVPSAPAVPQGRYNL